MDNDDDSNGIVTGVILSIIFLIIILMVVLSLLYRMKKLPRKVQKPIRSTVGKVKRSAAYTGISELIAKMRNKTTKRTSVHHRPPSPPPPIPVIDDEDTYCSIDDLDKHRTIPHEYLKCHQRLSTGRLEISSPVPITDKHDEMPDTGPPLYSYQYEDVARQKGNGKLPKMLVVPTKNTTSDIKESETRYDDDDIYNDPGFSDNEFDTESESGEDNHQHDHAPAGDYTLHVINGRTRRVSHASSLAEMERNELYDSPETAAVYYAPASSSYENNSHV